MNPLKKLAGQTGIYGLGVVARFFNYLLVPLHTSYFVTEQYGVITEMYAYVAFLVVLLTYGLETAFFRFSTKKGVDPNRVFSTLLISVISTSTIFILMAVLFREPIAIWLKYPNNAEYVSWFAIIVGLDAVSSLMLARLRSLNKAKKFVAINLANILVNIFFNVFFIVYFIGNYENGTTNWFIEKFHDPHTGVGYVFIANLIASVCKLGLLSPVVTKVKLVFDYLTWKKVLRYSLPILVAGLAGIANETIDRILIKWVLWPIEGEQETMTQLGIYGANYKMGILIALFLSALRYAAEPFYFNLEKEKNARQTYAEVMKWVVIILSIILLTVILNIEAFKYFISREEYWEGLHIVPIILLAYIALGIYQNHSIWFKLNERTYWGIVFTLIGATVTITLNLIMIPKIGYVGSAWATLACYVSMATASMIVGQKQFYIPYNSARIALYLIACVSIVILVTKLDLAQYGLLTYFTIHAILLLSYIALVIKVERLTVARLKSFLSSDSNKVP
ncbi:MAG: polysaccharide biosynthesis protein [Flavobacteriales bacterium]|nr:polysaccharide biosynthesis protein [Flavobacteriales bacterium]